MVVYDKVIENHIMKELPFMATENILMDAVLSGGDRQELHEKIRVHSMEAAKQVKVFGLENDLMDRIAADPAFGLDREKLSGTLDPKKYVGRAPEQTAEYVAQVRSDIIGPNALLLGEKAVLNV